MNINVQFIEYQFKSYKVKHILNNKKSRNIISRKSSCNFKWSKINPLLSISLLLYSIISFWSNNMLSCLNPRLNSSEILWPLHCSYSLYSSLWKHGDSISVLYKLSWKQVYYREHRQHSVSFPSIETPTVHRPLTTCLVMSGTSALKN